MLNGKPEEDVEAAGEKSSHKSCKKTDESDFHRLTFIRSSQFRYSWLPVTIYNSHLKRVEPVATRTISRLLDGINEGMIVSDLVELSSAKDMEEHNKTC